jgi:hypothetical protein
MYKINVGHIKKLPHAARNRHDRRETDATFVAVIVPKSDPSIEPVASVHAIGSVVPKMLFRSSEFRCT